MKNLTKEFLKDKFFENKNNVIERYVVEKGKVVNTYNYISSKPVLIYNEKAYSRNGFFFSVILRDEEYIQKIEIENSEQIIAHLDSKFSKKYEYEQDEDEEYDEIEEEIEVEE